jgi:hypothetical protein
MKPGGDPDGRLHPAAVRSPPNRFQDIMGKKKTVRRQRQAKIVPGVIDPGRRDCHRPAKGPCLEGAAASPVEGVCLPIAGKACASRRVEPVPCQHRLQCVLQRREKQRGRLWQQRRRRCPRGQALHEPIRPQDIRGRYLASRKRPRRFSWLLQDQTPLILQAESRLPVSAPALLAHSGPGPAPGRPSGRPSVPRGLPAGPGRGPAPRGSSPPPLRLQHA